MMDEPNAPTPGTNGWPPTPNQSEISSAEVMAAIASLRADVDRLSDALANLARNQATTAGAAISGAVEEAKDQARQTASEIQAYVSDAEARLRERIREKPLTAALMLTAFGYVVGRLKSVRRARY